MGSQLVVLWRTSTSCNLNCHFCAYAQSQNLLRKSTSLAELERMSQLLAEYQHKTQNRVLVSWLGGEPLLWPELEQASAFYWQREISLSLTTNGLLLDHARIQKFIFKYLSEITVSLDIEATSHDRYRGKKCFESILEKLQKLVQQRNKLHSKVKMRVNAILMRDNHRHLDSFIEILEQSGVDEVTFNELGGIERPEFWPLQRLLPNDILRIKETLAKKKTNTLLIKMNPSYLKRMLATAQNQSLCIENCRAIEEFLFIDEHSRMSPCTFTSQEAATQLQDIQCVEDLMRLKAKFAEMHQRELKVGPCSNCRSTYNYGKFSEMTTAP